MKYTKKPVTIDAIQFNGETTPELREFIDTDNYYWQDGTMLFIKTSEGDMRVNKGDYIIKEPFDKTRKFYPCKPDIFELTYGEPLEDIGECEGCGQPAVSFNQEGQGSCQECTDSWRKMVVPEVISIFRWLLGVEGGFKLRPEGKGLYYWRTELIEKIQITGLHLGDDVAYHDAVELDK